jgi:acyl carrier protein
MARLSGGKAMDNMRERISRVMAEQFRVPTERITEASSLDSDLGATSLDRVEVVMSLEDEFAIDISDDQAAELHTVADVLACVSANVARARAAAPAP